MCMFAVLIFSGCAGLSPELPQEQRMFTYIIDVPNMKEDEIFTKTMGWVSESFRSAKSVIQYQDKDAGVINGNGLMPDVYWNSFLKPKWDMHFMFSIDIKEEKLRIMINNIRTTNFYVGSGASTGEIAVTRQDSLEDFKKKAEIMIDDLKSYLNKKSSDW